MSTPHDGSSDNLKTCLDHGARLLAIGQKLSITVPAGLLLLCGVDAGATTSHNQAMPKESVASTVAASGDNEVVTHLATLRNERGGVLLAAHSGPLHTDTHVDKDDPNIITTNHTDGGVHTNTHSNIHTNNHGDADRS